MNARLSNLLPLLILVLLCTFSLWLSTGFQSDGATADRTRKHKPDMVVERFTAKKMDERGLVSVSMQAGTMKHFSDNNSAMVDDVDLIAYSRGQPPIFVRAPSATLRRLENGEDEVVLNGGVTLKSEDSPRIAGMQLETASMVFLPDRGIARSESDVLVHGKSGRITATRFVLDTSTRQVSLRNFSATLPGKP